MHIMLPSAGGHLPSESPLDADAARFSRVRGSFTLLMPMMFASVEGHLPSENPPDAYDGACARSRPADADDARFFGRGNCQARVHLMQMMLASFVATCRRSSAARFFGLAPAKRESG